MRKTSRSMPKLLLLVAGICVQLFVIAGCSTIAQKEREQEAANKGLDLLREITQKPTFRQTFQNYGFDSPEQATDLEFGRLLQIYWVRLDRLRQFHSGNDAQQLLEPPFEVIHPIKARGQVTSSITVTFSRNHKTWKASRFGASTLIRLLTQFPQYKNSNSSFVVRIPALNLYFLGDHISGQLLLTAIVTRPEFHWEAGQTLPAQEIFSRLVLAARARGDGPG